MTATQILLLTINPHAARNEGSYPPPTTPWPSENAFFDKKNIFPIKADIRTILGEIVRLRTGQETMVACALKKFVDENTVLASYVPFRTSSEAKITSFMWKFAENNYWNRILAIWQPRLLFTVGKKPFDNIVTFYRQMGWKVTTQDRKRISDYHPDCIGYFRTCTCEHQYTGVKTTILGSPHPAWGRRKGNKNCGYQDIGQPGRIPPTEAPVQLFLREKWNTIAF